MTKVITVAELDAMSDDEFVALFPAGGAVAGQILALAKTAAPDLGPSCPHCLNLVIDCVCEQLKERAS
jgi:hypothetical protein